MSHIQMHHVTHINASCQRITYKYGGEESRGHPPGSASASASESSAPQRDAPTSSSSEPAALLPNLSYDVCVCVCGCVCKRERERERQRERETERERDRERVRVCVCVCVYSCEETAFVPSLLILVYETTLSNNQPFHFSPMPTP